VLTVPGLLRYCSQEKKRTSYCGHHSSLGIPHRSNEAAAKVVLPILAVVETTALLSPGICVQLFHGEKIERRAVEIVPPEVFGGTALNTAGRSANWDEK